MLIEALYAAKDALKGSLYLLDRLGIDRERSNRNLSAERQDRDVKEGPDANRDCERSPRERREIPAHEQIPRLLVIAVRELAIPANKVIAERKEFDLLVEGVGRQQRGEVGHQA